MKKTDTRQGIVGRVRSNDARVIRVKAENSGKGILKTLILLAIIVSQICIAAFFHIEFALAFRSYVLFSVAMSLATCVYVLSSNKNSLSKAVWIIFILVGFSFGYIIYIISDEKIFFRKPKARYKKIFSDAKKYIDTSQEEVFNAERNVLNNGAYLSKTGGFKNYNNTELQYFPSGASFFDDVIEKCKSAEKFIFMEFYIVSDGVLMKRFFDVLSEKSKSGVDIRMIYDDMGSHRSLSGKMKARLRSCGIKLIPFNRLVPIFSVALNFRDHRKIVVIDGKYAYTGGVNFADEYINERRAYGYWKDSGIRLFGEAVESFTLMFLRQWEFVSKKKEDYSPYLSGVKSECKSLSVVVPYADGLDYERNIAKGVYENIISSAEKYLYIATPYLVLEDTLFNLLSNKATSGVDVRIVIPGAPDKKIVYGVTRNTAEKLTDYGVKVYCMKDSFVHSKLMISESELTVGSINMDLRSFYQQFECGVYTNDKKSREAVLSDFEFLFRSSRLINEKTKKRDSLPYRAVMGFLQLFAPLM